VTVLQNRKIRVFVVAVVTALISYGGHGIMSSSAYVFEAPALGLFYVKSTYHLEMNEYFNEKIALLVETPLEDPNQLPPTGEDVCGEKNVSTYCVSMGAVDRYEKYMDALDNIEGLPILESDIPLLIPVIAGGELNLGEMFGVTSARSAAIAQEKMEAPRLLDMVIAAYNELRLAYPMHEKYDDLIVTLTKYREALSDVRAKTERLRTKFVDTTSASCK
jgi:hypothetical protein